MLYRKKTKVKVIDLDELYNFVVDDFSIWNHLLPKKYLNFLYFKILILYSSIKPGWRNDQNIIGRSQWVLQLYFWQFFHISSFTIIKFNSKFIFYRSLICLLLILAKYSLHLLLIVIFHLRAQTKDK